MLIDYQQEIINELSEKSNHIFPKHKYISPMILAEVKFNQDFQIVSSLFWNKISRQYSTCTNCMMQLIQLLLLHSKNMI
jgi:hypothetical protein